MSRVHLELRGPEHSWHPSSECSLCPSPLSHGLASVHLALMQGSKLSQWELSDPLNKHWPGKPMWGVCGQLPQVQPAAGSLSELLQVTVSHKAAKMPQHQLLLLKPLCLPWFHKNSRIQCWAPTQHVWGLPVGMEESLLSAARGPSVHSQWPQCGRLDRVRYGGSSGMPTSQPDAWKSDRPCLLSHLRWGEGSRINM